MDPRIVRADRVTFEDETRLWVSFRTKIDLEQLQASAQKHGFKIVEFGTIPQKFPSLIGEITWDGTTHLIVKDFSGFDKLKAALGIKPARSAEIGMALFRPTNDYIARDVQGLQILLDYLDSEKPEEAKALIDSAKSKLRLITLTPSVWTSILRIAMGILYLQTLLDNLQKGLYGDAFAPYLMVFLKHSPLPWYSDFLNSVVLPNAALASTLQFLGDTTVGLSLLLGLLTPLGSAVGLFLIANIFLLTLGRVWPWTYIIMMAIFVVLMFSRSGRTLGLDHFLSKKAAKSWLW